LFLFLFPELKKKKKIFDGEEATRERGESSLLLLVRQTVQRVPWPVPRAAKRYHSSNTLLSSFFYDVKKARPWSCVYGGCRWERENPGWLLLLLLLCIVLVFSFVSRTFIVLLLHVLFCFFDLSRLFGSAERERRGWWWLLL
jgi:hypothetical protein